MPNFDCTGPDGNGPMTGFGRGFCVIPINTPERELDFLKNQARILQEQLNQIRSRIIKVKSEMEVQHARI